MQTRTTTIRLPRQVYERAKSVVEKERDGRDPLSLNELFVKAISAYLRAHERRQIDAAFAGMADDAGYQKEAKSLAADFGHSDWEALRLEEADLQGEPKHGASPSR